ncbi:MAG TPA: protein kinase [Thermoanaerobaculia bacterium]|nr:protein kinase [Thermoanaerobaculia bacterium]
MGLPEKSRPPEAYSLSQVPTEREPVPPPDWPAESASFQPPAHYEVLEALGNGGMGVLYKAEDTRLGRTVALKVLPLRFTNDPVAKERFLREARTASALDHQNICAIFDVGESDDGRLFLAMPCYQGETLRERLARGPLGLEEALDIAKQLARGLAKAHRLGIVHRDIKPENLMITTDGVVKILDFGIAKLAGASDLTGTEHRIGTPSYMAPEQSRKSPVDSRADLWALGVVLYEMITGRRPFRGANPILVLQAIQYGVPEPISEIRPGVPPRLEKVVARLLMKNPKARYPDAESVLADLDLEAAAAGQRFRRVWLAGGIVATLGLGLFATVLVEPGDSSSEGVVRFSPLTLTSQNGGEWYPSLSPDGERFVYARWDGSDYDLFLQDVDRGEPVNLTAGSFGDDTHPAFSPDGSQIAFRSERAEGGIFLMDLDAGRAVRRLTDFGYHPAWSPDGKVLLVSTAAITDPTLWDRPSRVSRIDVETSRKRLLLERDAVQPSWSPNGKRIAYWSVLTKNGRRMIWTVTADGRNPVPVDMEDLSINWNPVWSSDGYLYFVSDRKGSMSPWRIAIDEETGLTLGEPEPILAPSSWSGFLSLSRDGRRLIYSTSEEISSVERAQLDADSLPAPPRPVTGVATGLFNVRVSPQGDRIVLASAIGGKQEDLYLSRLDGTGDLVQLTHDEHRDRSPSWLPDGNIVFSSNRGGRYGLWTVRPGGTPQPLSVSYGEPLFSPVPSPDGRWLACASGLARAALLGSNRAPALLPLVEGTPFIASSWSPDSRSLAGVLNGKPGIFLYSLATRRYEKLTDSGWRPVWNHDGSKILFLDRGWKVFVLDLATRERREILAPPPASAYIDMDLDPARGLLYLLRQQPEGNVMMLDLE